MNISRRTVLAGAMSGAAGVAAGGRLAWAEAATSFPSRRIRMISPFAAGGQADVLCRKIGSLMSTSWNQTVITENKVGAGGVLGADMIAKSPPDGYTLGVIVPGILIQGFIDDKVPLNVARDVTPISCVVQNPKCIVVNANVPAKTLAELIELVRKDPARYGSYGTSGFGSRAHIGIALLNQMANTNFVHVPYRGASAILPDLMGGQLPIGVLDLGTIFTQMNSGKIRVLAVTGLSRSQALPDVPAVAESYPGFHAEEWYGLVAPAGVPPDIVEKIYGETKRWAGSADADAYAKTFGVELVANSPAEFGKLIATEQAYFAKLIPQLNIKAEAGK